MYARMVIGEAVSDEQTREFASIYAAEVLPELREQPGFESGRLMIEENGRMAVSLTLWKTRNDCLRYHSSRAYRKFVMRTQHLLVGNFVVKLFHDTEADPTDEPEKGPNAGPDNDGNGRVA